MKKITAFLFIFATMFSFTACRNDVNSTATLKAVYDFITHEETQ